MLTLQKTKYLPSLGGKTWDNDNEEHSFEQTQRLYIKRARIDVIIILAGSSEASKYELFQRLNTGGSELSDQELRNCILISIDPDAYRWLEALATDNDFPSLLSLTERLQSRQYHLELVLRFILLYDASTQDLSDITDIGEYITDRMTELAIGHKLVSEATRDIFRRTFAVIAQTLRSQAFQRFDANDNRFTGSFLISAFEAVSLGIAENIDAWEQQRDQQTALQTAIQRLWRDNVFTGNIGSGIRASQRVPRIVPRGREIVTP